VLPQLFYLLGEVLRLLPNERDPPRRPPLEALRRRASAYAGLWFQHH
jgi:hypothetical protein